MLLRYKFAAGEVLKYRVIFKQYRASKGTPGREEELESAVSIRVLVAEETFHLVCHTQLVRHQVNGEAQPMTQKPPVLYMELDPCGKVVASTDLNVLLGLLLPEEDINPGEKWETHKTMVPGNRTTATEVLDRFTLQAVKDGVAHIAYHFEELTYTGDRPETENQKWSTRARGAYRFDTEAGRLLEMHVENVTTLTVGDEVSQLTTLRKLQLER